MVRHTLLRHLLMALANDLDPTQHNRIIKKTILIIVVPFTLLMAWFSYKYIEEPILRRRPKMPNF